MGGDSVLYAPHGWGGFGAFPCLGPWPHWKRFYWSTDCCLQQPDAWSVQKSFIFKNKNKINLCALMTWPEEETQFSGKNDTITTLMAAVSFFLFLTNFFAPMLSSCLPTGYRHVYLEGLTEASIFVHVSVHDVYGKVSAAYSCRYWSIPHLILLRLTEREGFPQHINHWSYTPSILCLYSGAL